MKGGINGITDAIKQVRGGLPEKHASQQFEDLIRACKDSGKKGTITLTVTVEPHGKDNTEMYLYVKSKTTLPTNPDLHEPGIFFTTRNGTLVRDDPNQQDLGLRGIGGGDGEEEASNTGDNIKKFG